jgi:hypothetical protein
MKDYFDSINIEDNYDYNNKISYELKRNINVIDITNLKQSNEDQNNQNKINNINDHIISSQNITLANKLKS